MTTRTKSKSRNRPPAPAIPDGVDLAGIGEGLSEQIRDPKQRALIGALSYCIEVQPACDAAGVCRDTYHRWRRDVPEFAEAADQARRAGAERIIGSMAARARAGEVIPGIFITKNLLKETYGERACLEVEHYHPPIQQLPPSPKIMAEAIRLLLNSTTPCPQPLVETVIEAEIENVQPPRLTEGEQKH
jgi:hypothetical protein